MFETSNMNNREEVFKKNLEMVKTESAQPGSDIHGLVERLQAFIIARDSQWVASTLPIIRERAQRMLANYNPYFSQIICTLLTQKHIKYALRMRAYGQQGRGSEFDNWIFALYDFADSLYGYNTSQKPFSKGVKLLDSV